MSEREYWCVGDCDGWCHHHNSQYFVVYSEVRFTCDIRFKGETSGKLVSCCQIDSMFIFITLIERREATYSFLKNWATSVVAANLCHCLLKNGNRKRGLANCVSFSVCLDLAALCAPHNRLARHLTTPL